MSLPASPPDYFGAMYREIAISPQHEVLVARWAGMTKAVNESSVDLVESALLIARGTPIEKHRRRGFQDFFLGVDSSFDLTQVEETRLLANVFLRVSVRYSLSNLALAAATAVCSSDFLGLRNPRTHGALLAESVAYIQEKSVSVRAWKIPVRAAQTLAVSGEASDALARVDRLTTSIKAFVKAHDAQVRQISIALGVQQEQSDILWWLSSEFSFLLNKDLVELTTVTAAVCAASEIMNCVRTLPAPIAASAFLRKALSRHPDRNTPMRISDVLLALEPGALRGLPLANGKSSLARELLDLSALFASHDKDAFLAGLDRSNADLMVTPLQIGEQLISEITADRSWERALPA